MGGFFQLCRGLRLRRKGGHDDRQGSNSSRHRGSDGDLGRADRCHILGPLHLVFRLTDQLLARLIGGFAGAAVVKAGWGRDYRRGIPQNCGLYRDLAGARVGIRLRLDGRRAANLSVRPLTEWTDFSQGTAGVGGLYSLGHGTNDAQKTMGLIYILLITTGRLSVQSSVPVWVILSVMPPSPSEPFWVAGGSSRPWVRRSPSSGRSVGSAPRPEGRSCSSARRSGHSREHDPYDHRRDHGRRRNPAPLRRALGHRGKNYLGLAFDNSRCRGGIRSQL